MDCDSPSPGIAFPRRELRARFAVAFDAVYSITVAGAAPGLSLKRRTSFPYT